MVRSVIRAALAALVVAASLAAARAEERLALVIGIGTYQHLPLLSNAVADSTLIAGKLHDLGFAVTELHEATSTQLKQAIRDFGHRIEEAGRDVVALVYFAGHGLQDSKQANYLLAADADIRSEVDLPLDAIALDSILQTLEEARPRLAFAIIDACRNTVTPEAATRGLRRGLGVEADRHGLLIAFSTEPGKTAADGLPGGHSPFAAALAEQLDVPGQEATQLFRTVSLKVFDATHQEQFPWVTQRLTENFIFRPALVNAPGPAPAAPAPVAPTTAAPAIAAPDAAQPRRAAEPSALDAGEMSFFRAVDTNTRDAYEDWLRRFPDHPRHSSVVALLERLNEEELWQRAEAAPSPERKIAALQHLQLAFPTGIYSTKAQQRIAELERVLAPQLPQALPPTRPTVSRYQGMDAPGNDRGPWHAEIPDASACEALCLADRGCLGYTYNINRRVCIPKNQIARLELSPEPAVTGVVTDRGSVPVAEAPQAQIRHFPFMDAAGNDRGAWIRGIAKQDCENRCVADPGCAGYTYNFKRRTCIPKDAIGPLSTATEPAETGIIDRRP